MKHLQVTLALLCLTGAVAWAQAPVLNNHIANVSISENHVIVVEMFDLTLGDDFNELFIPIQSRYLSEASSPKVTNGGESQPFELVNPWNSDAPTDAKLHRYGLLKKGDNIVEICFGVEQNTTQKYYVSYVLKNMLYTTPEADVLEYPFVNHGTDLPARSQELRVKIKDRSITPEDLDMEHSFADGDIQLRNGVVYITPKKENKAVTVLKYRLCFKKGTFSGLPQYNLPLRPMTADSSSVTPSGANPLLADQFTPEELNSPMMKTSNTKNESGYGSVIDYVMGNPLKSVCIGWVVVITLFFLIRKIVKKVI